VRHYLKNFHRKKRAGGMAKAAECLSSKCKDLSSNPLVPTKKKGKNTNKKLQWLKNDKFSFRKVLCKSLKLH
jgi:hypothetical protein